MRIPLKVFGKFTIPSLCARRALPAVIALLLLGGLHRACSETRVTLWEIGKSDGDNREFALSPDRWAQYRADGVYFVGESDAAKDWPYVQPGPRDAWAGSQQHSFIIVFGLSEASTAGEIKLKVRLLDTQSFAPPRLEFNLNGQVVTRTLSGGAGDASIEGQPSKGKSQDIEVGFPAGSLRRRQNQLRITTVDGCWMLYDSLSLDAPAGTVLAPVKQHTLITGAKAVRALKRVNGKLLQPVNLTVRHLGEARSVTVQADGGSLLQFQVTNGVNVVELLMPSVASDIAKTIRIEAGGELIAEPSMTLKPVRPLTVYILPHSHTDIGYTEIQTAVEDKQVQNLIDGIAAARRTADYPEGARFVWNVEALWAADLYLQRLDEKQKAEFFDAVKRGDVALSGMYLNELTGLCRPEELLRLFRFATEIAGKTGKPIDSAMISDVPGYTWGTVTALSQAGIRYFNAAPNYFDRIGTILREWENKPFWWVGPDGKSKVLVWIPFWGYAMSHRYGSLSPQFVDDFCDGLVQRGYPYDIAHVRWSGHGDNAVPDPAICDFVRDWNARYAWPHFIISGVHEAFHAMESKYGDQLPVVRGDWTPYWEDGAGSSALETAMNRESADRLTQAETLWAMRDAKSYPSKTFSDAWRNVLLYSEHTWGADCSVWDPERQKTKEQWEIKRGYAVAAKQQSDDLLIMAMSLPADTPPSDLRSTEIDVINTTSWRRSELVTLSEGLSAVGDRITDDRGKPVPSQRLLTGELVFMASDVPALGARRYTVSRGEAYINKRAVANGPVLDSGKVRVRVDEQTGAIVELKAAGIEGNFVDTSSGRGLNDYLYLIADDLKDLQRNGLVTIRVGEPGPLVASLIIESSAPGCKKLIREVRVVAGMDSVEFSNDIDKERASYPAKAEYGEGDYRNRAAKESVNFAFEFNIPDGDVRLDIPLGLMRPEIDQIPSACKNWFTVGRWAEVANRNRGIQWVTMDAPLVQVGGITATLLNSQTDPDVWRKQVDRTQKLYSWAMNNHWGTNYRAYQEGLTRFRFVLRPYKKSSPAENSRFAIGLSQPLLPMAANSSQPPAASLLRLSNDDVLILGMKPSDDGKAIIIRLFGASDKASSTRILWEKIRPKSVSFTDTSEEVGAPVQGKILVPSQGLVSVRAEL